MLTGAVCLTAVIATPRATPSAYAATWRGLGDPGAGYAEGRTIGVRGYVVRPGRPWRWLLHGYAEGLTVGVHGHVVCPGDPAVVYTAATPRAKPTA
jgi:hypothetical protein